MSEKRKCHLCNEPTIDKYCENTSCAEFIRDENNLGNMFINFTQDDLYKLQEQN